MKKLVILISILLTNNVHAYYQVCHSPHTNGKYSMSVLDDMNGSAYLYFQNLYQGNAQGHFATKLTRTEIKKHKNGRVSYTYRYAKNGLKKEVRVSPDLWIMDKSLGRYSSTISYEKDCKVYSKEQEQKMLEKYREFFKE